MTVSYDPLLDTNTDDPYELYRQFRRQRPVYYNEERNLWALFDYEDVMATLPDWKRFSNHWQDNDPKIFLESDPPRHAELRAVIMMTWVPSLANTSSKTRVNLLSGRESGTEAWSCPLAAPSIVPVPAGPPMARSGGA